MIAQELGKLTGVPVDCFMLAMVKRTPSQVGLTAAQRRKNVAGAFRVTAAKGALRDKRVVVVDDVITTCATAEACARVLKRAGASRVDILALARAVEPSAMLLSSGICVAIHLLTLKGRSRGTSMTRVVLYTTPYCGYCRAAKHLLGKKGVTFTEIDVSEDMERRREMIERAFGRRMVPQIFINDTHVGGYDELAELELAEKLDALLAEAGAVASVPGE
jgi:glutaredoxin 3